MRVRKMYLNFILAAANPATLNHNHAREITLRKDSNEQKTTHDCISRYQRLYFNCCLYFEFAGTYVLTFLLCLSIKSLTLFVELYTILSLALCYHPNLTIENSKGNCNLRIGYRKNDLRCGRISQ